MSAQFAGARSLDERRRRRLAGESQSSPPPKRSRPRSGEIPQAENHEASEKARPFRISHSPLSVAIPKTLWKMRLIGIGVLTVMTGLLIAGVACKSDWLVEARELLDLEHGRIWSVMTGLTLFVCAQLSLVILWFRRLSVRDFDGRYRTWLWAAANFSFFSVVSFLDLQTIFGQVMCDLTRLPAIQWQSLIWLTPTVGLLLDVLRNLEREITRVPEAWWHLSLASMLGSASAVCLWAESSTFMFAPGWAVIRACSVLSCGTLFYSLMLFARHVLYFSVDPAPRRKSMSGEMLKNLGQVTRLAFAPVLAQLSLRTEERKQRNERQQRIKHLCVIVRNSYRDRQEQHRREQQQQMIQQRELQKTQRLQAIEAAKAEKKAAVDAANAQKLQQKQKAIEERERLKAEKLQTAKLSADQKAAAKQALLDQKAAEKQAQLEQKAADKQATLEQKAREKLAQKQAAEDSQQQTAAKKPRIRLGGGASKSDSAATELSGQSASEDQKLADMKQQSGKIVRHDQADPIDPDALKGLSKKERRRLRKQHRDLQRQNGSDDDDY